jgi:hypothetical protein
MDLSGIKRRALEAPYDNKVYDESRERSHQTCTLDLNEGLE